MELISEIWGWIVIVFTFACIGIGACLVISHFLSGEPGIFAGVAFALMIMYVGVRIANRAYKGKGTIFLLSRTIATPELDNNKLNSEESEDLSSNDL